MRILLIAAFLASTFLSMATAQNLRVSTVTRPPFSMLQDGADTGFSIDLWQALMQDMRRNSEFVRADQFSQMLDMVEDGSVDAAIAISRSPPSAKGGLISASRSLNPACKS